MGLDKDYGGSIRLGMTTDTLDMEGRVLSTSEVEAGETDLRGAFAALTGPIEQIPPSYSAIKIGGRKLCDMARRGITVAPQPRAVVVSRFDLLGYEKPEARFFLSCSKGTYVRSLAEEVGRRLGCGATLSALVRTRIGPYSLERALDETRVREYSSERFEAALVR